MIQDWAEGRCLTKALLNCVSGMTRDNDAGGLSVYINYMNETSLIDLDVSFSGLSRFGRIDTSLIADLQYKLQSPNTEPAHWSIFSKDDVARLGNMLNVRFVIYAYTGPAAVPYRLPDRHWSSAPMRAGQVTMVHDFRGVEETNPGRLVGIVITAKAPQRLFKVSEDELELIDALTKVEFVEMPGRPAEVGVDVRDCDNDYLRAVDRLLHMPDRQTEERCQSMRQIVEIDRHKLFQRWGQPVMIAHFSRCLGKGVLRSQKKSPTSFLFTCLAIACELTSPDCEEDFADHATPDTIVVAVYAEKFVCLVAEDVRLQILVRHLDTRGMTETLANRGDLSGVPRTLPASVVAEACRKKLEERRSRRPRRAIPKLCTCFDCRSPQYTQNMAPAGPERLCTVPYTLSELLDMLGALDESAKRALKRMVNLSIASMDLESLTLDLDLSTPHPGPRVRFDEFGGPTLAGHVKKTQRPVMVGHTDTLSREAGVRWFDVVADDSPKAVFDMMARYWLHVTRLQRAAIAAKKELCKELFELAGLYKTAYMTFSSGWLEASVLQRNYLLAAERTRLTRLFEEDVLGDDEYKHRIEEAEERFLNSEEWKMASLSDLLAAFRSTIPGQLETKLRKLCHRYVVFNFYG